MDCSPQLTGSTAAIGYGLAAIGPGIGVGIIFAAYIQSTARQPESARMTLPYVWIGFAVVEALALLGIAFGFVFSAANPVRSRPGGCPCCASSLAEEVASDRTRSSRSGRRSSSARSRSRSSASS